MTQHPVLDKPVMTPHKKWVFAKLLPDQETEAGLIATVNKNNKLHRVEIISIGNQVKYAKPGDIIRFTHNIIYGLEFLIEGEKFLFLQEGKHLLFKE